MQTVVIYSKPDCVQCTMTKNWFADKKVEYTEEDILDDQTLEAVRSLGMSAAPVIFVSQGVPGDEQFWAGFQPGKLKEFVTTNTKE
jgi:glutaredoxin-like protein NrdH